MARKSDLIIHINLTRHRGGLSYDDTLTAAKGLRRKTINELEIILKEERKAVNQQTAYQWHGGQWSPLYSFASTGCTVHDEAHRNGLENEISDCINYDTTAPEEKNRLITLLSFVKSSVVKTG